MVFPHNLLCWLHSRSSWIPDTPFNSFAGELVWRRHVGLPLPSSRVIRTTCMELLPLVEMYCRWELKEDCSDLRALMLRFDSEWELETHELGRSLLYMLRNDDLGLDSMPRQVHLETRVNPFDDIRERLAASAIAIREMHDQVLPIHPCLLYPHSLQDQKPTWNTLFIKIETQCYQNCFRTYSYCTLIAATWLPNPPLSLCHSRFQKPHKSRILNPRPSWIHLLPPQPLLSLAAVKYPPLPHCHHCGTFRESPWEPCALLHVHPWCIHAALPCGLAGVLTPSPCIYQQHTVQWPHMIYLHLFVYCSIALTCVWLSCQCTWQQRKQADYILQEGNR